jgi:hypothetical protein
MNKGQAKASKEKEMGRRLKADRKRQKRLERRQSKRDDSTEAARS